MNTRTAVMTGVILLALLAGPAGTHLGAQPLEMPAGVESSFDVEEATVLKVFSATEDDHRFVAYLVTWHGADVIVSDSLAESNYEVGDTIRFLAQRMRLPRGDGQVSSLSFSLLAADRNRERGADAQGEAVPLADQQRIMRVVQGDLEAVRDDAERFVALTQAARKALDAGKTDEARRMALELERLAPDFKTDWNYGNAVQNANQVLGRIALAEGDVEEAKRRLLASADSRGSPQMNSFGPNMRLARELLINGETEVVLTYFERCAEFWGMGEAKLEAWAATVRQGGIPEFGANLNY